MAQGEELLIAEAAERDRSGLRSVFEAEGFVCTVATSTDQVRELFRRKFFPVAVIDLDFGGTNEGLALAAHAQQVSQPTKIVMLTSRRSFEAAVSALRVGVVDIVNKRPDQVSHLRGAVSLALDRYHSSSKDSALVREARAVLDDAVRIMLGLGRKLYGSETSSASLRIKPAILIVDPNQAFLQKVANLLADRPWDVSVELRGGSGLDRASSFAFQIVCVRDELADLPGHMLVRTAQAQKQAPLGLVYSEVGAGHVDRYEGGVPKHIDQPFVGPEHLVRVLDKLVEELQVLREERRYLQAFRSDYGPFFKRFADLKARIDSLSG
ncbi:MAG TPA: response regulator [Polyangiales bacterium]|nr:response regulator [Polyangiales bacterium]